MHTTPKYSISDCSPEDIELLIECGQPIHYYIQKLKSMKSDSNETSEEKNAKLKIIKKYGDFNAVELGLIVFEMMIDRDLDILLPEHMKRLRKPGVFNDDPDDDDFDNEVYEYFQGCGELFLASLEQLHKGNTLETLEKINYYQSCESRKELLTFMQPQKYGVLLMHKDFAKIPNDKIIAKYKDLFNSHAKDLEVSFTDIRKLDKTKGQLAFKVNLHKTKGSCTVPFSELKNAYDDSIQAIKADTSMTEKEKEKATLHAIFNFVSWVHNFHFFENANARLSNVFLNKLLIENDLPSCIPYHQNNFCLEYPLRVQLYRENGGNIDDALDVYYEGTKYYQQMKQNIIEKRGNLKNPSSEKKIELNATQPSNPLNLNLVKPFSIDSITRENVGKSSEKSILTSNKTLKPENKTTSNDLGK